jgi:predicted DNA-binding transcriptional regulator AlpA
MSRRRAAKAAQEDHKKKLNKARKRVAQQQAKQTAQLRALAGAHLHPDFGTSIAASRIERERAEQRSFGRVLLSAEDLWQLGFRYSRVQLWKLVKAGLFPAPIKLSANRNAYLLSQLLTFIEQRVAERDDEPERVSTSRPRRSSRTAP